MKRSTSVIAGKGGPAAFPDLLIVGLLTRFDAFLLACTMAGAAVLAQLLVRKPGTSVVSSFDAPPGFLALCGASE